MEHYTPHVPDGMELNGQLGANPDVLEFWVTHYVGSSVVYGGTFCISHEALDDGHDVQPGLEALLERARRGTLPHRHMGEAAPLVLLCTSARGLQTVG